MDVNDDDEFMRAGLEEEVADVGEEHVNVVPAMVAIA